MAERSEHAGGLEGWAITAVVSGVVLAAVLLAFAGGFDEEAVRALVRSSAKIAALLLCATFSASSLRRLWKSDLSSWLLRNRRYLGVGVAVAHFTHLTALFVLGLWFPDPFVPSLDLVTLIGGGFGYLLLLGMTVTSFDGPAEWLGRTSWKRLHVFGSYVLWLFFLQSYAGRVLVEGQLFYLPFALSLLAAWGLRMWVRFGSRRAGTARAAAAG